MSGQGVINDSAKAAQNVASQLARHARERPHQAAVIEHAKGSREDYICVVDLPSEENAKILNRVLAYQSISYARLHSESMKVAAGLVALGVQPGDRIALMVRPGIDFVMLVFAIFQSGAVAILIDPGMGRKNLLACLSEAKPDGFIALPIVHAIRLLYRSRFPQARFLVTVGRRYGWGGLTLRRLRKLGAGRVHTVTAGGDGVLHIWQLERSDTESPVARRPSPVGGGCRLAVASPGGNWSAVRLHTLRGHGAAVG